MPVAASGPVSSASLSSATAASWSLGQFASPTRKELSCPLPHSFPLSLTGGGGRCPIPFLQPTWHCHSLAVWLCSTAPGFDFLILAFVLSYLERRGGDGKKRAGGKKPLGHPPEGLASVSPTRAKTGYQIPRLWTCPPALLGAPGLCHLVPLSAGGQSLTSRPWLVF